MHQTIRAILTICALLFSCGCDQDQDFATETEVKAEISGAIDRATPPCTPNLLVFGCRCSGMPTGSQRCADDGKRFEDCACPAPISPESVTVACDAVHNDISAAFSGRTGVELAAGVRCVGFSSKSIPPYSQCMARMDDSGLVLAPCTGDSTTLVFVP